MLLQQLNDTGHICYAYEQTSTLLPRLNPRLTEISVNTTKLQRNSMEQCCNPSVFFCCILISNTPYLLCLIYCIFDQKLIKSNV